MFKKPVSQLRKDDLGEVVGAAETDSVEFKRDAYGKADEDVREFLRDISSMANAVGGHLLIGVETDGEERAIALPGIENAGEEALRMMSMTRANIEEQMIGFDIGVVDIGSGRGVIICYVPRSTRAPHQITYKGLFQCWKRHGRLKAKMTIEEIRESCIRVENIRQNLEEFSRYAANRIWNAYGLEDCPLFDAKGEFDPKGIDQMWL